MDIEQKTRIIKYFKKIKSDISLCQMRELDVKSGVPFTISITKKNKNEQFILAVNPNIDSEIILLDSNATHLLIMARYKNNTNKEEKMKILCGHDERLFACVVPDSSCTIKQAEYLLKPEVGLKSRKRKNKAMIRQGEWFFIPCPELKVDGLVIYKNEPISRGNGSKPHIASEICRIGGDVWYHRLYAPNGISKKVYQSHPNKGEDSWRVMVRNAKVYARGAVRHSDHRTVKLKDWHRVLINRENESNSIAFLD